MKLERLESSSLARALPRTLDLLVLSASFESRCKSVADIIDPGTVKRAIVAQNRNHAEFHDDHAKYLLARFQNSQLMELDTSDPTRTADSMLRSLKEASKFDPRNILIDISTFTREAFLILYRIINHLWGYSTPVNYVYARAKEYSVGSASNEKWLSRGVADVRSVLGYPGEFEPSRCLHLIALVGFEYERVAELIRRCEPSVISLGYASPRESDGQDHLEGHRYSFERLRSVFGEVGMFAFPGYDPTGARDAILRQFRSRSGYNCMLAPMNTKLSTMGAVQAALVESSIQIVYSQAIIYNVKAYSEPGDAFYLVSGKWDGI